jgi:hypothetical protein
MSMLNIAKRLDNKDVKRKAPVKRDPATESKCAKKSITKNELKEMIREMLKEELSKSKELKEAYIPYDSAFYFEDLDISLNAVMDFARSIVYSLVSDPEEAEALSDWAEANDSWNSEEYAALCDLIGDALEGANYHDEVDTYMRSNNTFPYWISSGMRPTEHKIVNDLIKECKTEDQKKKALWNAINSLVLEL